MSSREAKEKYMGIAVREAYRGVAGNAGGPFGAVIVKDGEVIARGHNRVVRAKDPTAHAEIVAIRRASKKLGRFDLSDCEIYSTCEPCPMCLAAILWAKIPRVYFGCTKEDAAKIGFADEAIDKALKGRKVGRRFRMVPMAREACLKLFALWQNKSNRVLY